MLLIERIYPNLIIRPSS